METEYYTGVAISEPNVDDVLNSLIIDSRASDYNFEDWADEFGYDTDSRKAEQIYNNCLEIGKKVNNLLGDDKIDFEEKYENY